jgi:hypothetical protein
MTDVHWSLDQFEMPEVPYSPIGVSVFRRCLAAENGGCHCTGACRKEIPLDERISALRSELDRLTAEPAGS